VETFDVPDLTFDYAPSFNVAPGQAVPVLAQDRRGRRIGPLVWGLLPSWSSPSGRTFINARSETVADTRSFRDSFAARRCLVPADGFYEWRREGASRTPFWFHRPDRGLFTMAAIWDHWSAPGSESRHTFAILTTEASADVRGVHHRMPVVIPEADREAWLQHDSSARDLMDLMEAADGWARHRVDRRVGSPANNDAGLIEPV
jgi:putative SOS response-associated peptidase YedK